MEPMDSEYLRKKRFSAYVAGISGLCFVILVIIRILQEVF
jgi:hypothetical protein